MASTSEGGSQGSIISRIESAGTSHRTNSRHDRHSSSRSGKPKTTFANRSRDSVGNRHDHKKMRSSLRRYLAITYGPGKTKPEKAFIFTLNKYGDFSLRLLVVYIFAMWVIGSFMSLTMYLSTEVDIIVRCKIPALEPYFNFLQVLNISVKNKVPSIQYHHSIQYCSYDDRDYVYLIQRYGCNYSSIMHAIENITVVKTKPCEQFIVCDSKFLTIIHGNIDPRTYYKWYCNKNIWYKVFNHLDGHGMLYITLLLVAHADLYGRKRAFIISSILFVIGCFLTLLPTQWCLFIGIIIQSAYMIGFTSLYVLVIEMCNNSMLLAIGALMSVIYGTAVIISLVFYYTIWSWMYKQLAKITLLLVVPFGIWFMQESPRWLMFTGKQPEAWKVLMEWESDIEPIDLNTLDTEKRKVESMLTFFNKSLFRKRITICCTFSFLYHISKYHISRVNITSYDRDHLKSYYLIVTSFQIIVVPLVNLVAVLYGRKRTLFTLYCISVPINAIMFMTNDITESTLFHQLLLRCADTLKISEYFIVLLYVCEMFPTPYRVTALNFCMAFNLLGIIIKTHLYELVDRQATGITYMPLFLASAACMLIIYFLPETHGVGLPDTQRDAL